MKKEISEPQGFGFKSEIDLIKFVDRFTVPPFSVFDTRQGYWQARKNEWIDLGIESDIGRNSNLIGYSKLTLLKGKSGTSVFDPVLCEISYSWFCPPGGKILDPFAGGSVRGIVAAILGYSYTGIDLRQAQIDENEKQWKEIKKKKIANDKPVPKWICGNALDIQKITNKQYDLIFTCPPYGDLEKYSDDPADLSNMPWEDFLEAYFEITKESCSLLKEDRFAVIIVSDFRDRNGFYRKFPLHTINAFETGKCLLYNDGILVTAVGSLPIRTGKFFEPSRKLGKTHQNYLVFYKGDPKNIRNLFKI